jgi:hypothetical protein
MTELEKAKIIHDKAMLLSQEADMAKIWNDTAKAQTLYKQSFELEREAAYLYSDRFDKEPMRSMLYLSAASLAMLCDLYFEADVLIQQGFSSSTPPDMIEELQDLKRKIQERTTHLERPINMNQDQAFWISGILRRVDADKNTIKLASKATDTIPQTHYTINVVSETLNKLVKNYWGDIVKVYIKPKIKNGKAHQYELIDIS